MWDKITTNLKKYDNAVLTGIDANGYPFSVRCIPQIDAYQLRVQLSPSTQMQSGQACLLCHRHNEFLWEMESFLLKGSLARDEHGWYFLPQRFIPGNAGAGKGAMIASIRWLLNARRNTRRYLEKRHLPRPRIPWDEIKQLRTQALRTR